MPEEILDIREFDWGDVTGRIVARGSQEDGVNFTLEIQGVTRERAEEIARGVGDDLPRHIAEVTGIKPGE